MRDCADRTRSSNERRQRGDDATMNNYNIDDSSHINTVSPSSAPLSSSSTMASLALSRTLLRHVAPRTAIRTIKINLCDATISSSINRSLLVSSSSYSNLQPHRCFVVNAAPSLSSPPSSSSSSSTTSAPSSSDSSSAVESSSPSSDSTSSSSTAVESSSIPTVVSQTPSQQQQSSSSSSSTPAEGTSKADRLGFGGFESYLASLRAHLPHVKTYIVWIGVGVGMLTVFKMGFSVVDFFATLNFLDVGEVAFIGGVISGVGLVFCAWLGTRFLRLRPEAIFKHSLKRVTADTTVRQYLGGGDITSGAFRAYSYVNGSVRLTKADRQKAAHLPGVYKYWQPKRLQLFFQISGKNGQVGMVSAEVEKNLLGDHTYNLLSVDLESKDGGAERIVLEGDTSYKIYKGIIKLR